MTTADLTTSQSNQGDAEVTPDWLAEAQKELAEVADEAREEGYPVPSELAFENARRLLPAVYRILPRQVAVYPTPDGEICIDIPRRVGPVGWPAVRI